MDTREAYQELGVDPNVSDVELKAIWRRLVAAWHPDRNATVDASRRMQHINKAYQHIRQLRDGQSASTDDGGHAETQAGQPKASDSPEPEEHTTRGNVYWQRLARHAAAVVPCAKRPSLAGCGTKSRARIAVATDAIASHVERATAPVNRLRPTDDGFGFRPGCAMAMF
jgi:hypothetical protein